jgi:hypothetical protein
MSMFHICLSNVINFIYWPIKQVNLGVIQENPSTTGGTIGIMTHLQRYVPLAGDEQPFPVLCHGDQLSVERMLD